MSEYSRKILSVVLLILITANFAFSINIAEEERRVFELVNAERRKIDLPAYNLNNDLAKIAREYAEKMAREKFFGHVDNEGKAVETRAREKDIKKFEKIGENLFFCAGYDNPAKFALNRWLNSQTHRENILDGYFSETGIGIAETGKGEIYMVQIFLEP